MKIERWPSLWLLASALVLAACGGLAQTPEAPEGPAATEPTVEPTEKPAAMEPSEQPTEEMRAPFIEVGDQDLEDGKVTIAKVFSDAPGWVVIHIEAEGKPGAVIGYASVAAGESRDVEVEIDQDQATQTLFAMLHLDAGTSGEYEFPGEDVPVKVGDSIVNVPFNLELRVEPRVEVSDQAIKGGTVTIERVSSPDQGWIVIHVQAEGGGPGPVIGFAPLSPGNNAQVVVKIDPDAATERLFAMLHLDAGTLGEYEFPGDDVPVKAGEEVVVKPFTLLAPDALSGTIQVSIRDSRFERNELRITAGSTVVWTHMGNLPHTVTADGGAFDSGRLRTGDVFRFTFTEPGTYAYYCNFHGGPGGKGMSGVIVVVEG